MPVIFQLGRSGIEIAGADGLTARAIGARWEFGRGLHEDERFLAASAHRVRARRANRELAPSPPSRTRARRAGHWGVCPARTGRAEYAPSTRAAILPMRYLSAAAQASNTSSVRFTPVLGWRII